MKFKEGDIVKVISVSGHSDMTNALGMLAQVKSIRDDRGFHRDGNAYDVRIKYILPVEYITSSGHVECIWHEWFKESELELYNPKIKFRV